jgi:hypothetical protein
MSATQGIDARGYLKGWLAALQDMYGKDVRAIPEDKWNATFGGCTRSACELTADAVQLLDWAAEALRGNVIAVTPSPDRLDGMKSECATRDAATARLGKSCGQFVAALSDASDEALNAMVTPPWQMPTPLYMIAQIAVSHVWYHDGQLNYIQSLLGDDKVHWMEA